MLSFFALFLLNNYCKNKSKTFIQQQKTICSSVLSLDAKHLTLLTSILFLKSKQKKENWSTNTFSLISFSLTSYFKIFHISKKYICIQLDSRYRFILIKGHWEKLLISVPDKRFEKLVNRHKNSIFLAQFFVDDRINSILLSLN